MTVVSDKVTFASYSPINDDPCPICLEPPSQDLIKPWLQHYAETSKTDQFLQHFFHEECLRNSLKAYPTCPNCRKLVDLTSVFSREELPAFNSRGNLTFDSVKDRINSLNNTLIPGHEMVQPLIGALVLVAGYSFREEYSWTTSAICTVATGLFGYLASWSVSNSLSRKLGVPLKVSIRTAMLTESGFHLSQFLTPYLISDERSSDEMFARCMFPLLICGISWALMPIRAKYVPPTSDRPTMAEMIRIRCIV